MYVYFMILYVTTSLSSMRVYQNNHSGRRQPPAIVANSSLPPRPIASSTIYRNTHLNKMRALFMLFYYNMLDLLQILGFS